ncbi:MAG TPA: MFS transporter, partial [Thermoanaerobaculia bacterium]|nr:MFS transporter [Thermoanaerobaculia bacterium]
MANTLELFERFAFYGSKAVLAKYLADTVGLGLSGLDFMKFYGLAVFGLPVLAGPVVDRFGFKKSLVACFSIFAAGYGLVGLAGMPQGRGLVDALGPKLYVFLALMVTAIGGSLIKPCIVGTVARTTSQATKSLGYSIYYSLVNFGGALGPILALLVRQTFGIQHVFIVFAGTSLLLALATLALFKEPGSGDEPPRTFGRVLKDAALVFANVRFISFLVIFSGFWIMFWQVFFSLPFYATEVIKFEKYELLETADAWTIFLLTVPITALATRLRPMLAMTLGFALASGSWLIIAIGQSWQAVVIALVFFALGEMLQAPRFYEYVADLAPKDQVGTFMGFAFLPVAIGYFVAGFLAKYLIQHYLRDLHQPRGMWVLLSVLGFATTVLMVLYDR